MNIKFQEISSSLMQQMVLTSHAIVAGIDTELKTKNHVTLVTTTLMQLKSAFAVRIHSAPEDILKTALALAANVQQ